MAQRWPDFVYRPEQQSLAHSVAKLFSRGGVLLAEAPTGTGKTFAYLAPALQSPSPTLISTASLALQQQLVGRDIPLLAKLLRRRPVVVELVGASNYYCPQQAETALSNSADPRFFDALHRMQQIWSKRPDPVVLWRELAEQAGTAIVGLSAQVSISTEQCLRQKCRYFHRCPYFSQRKKLLIADIAVVNHALFYTALEGLSDSYLQHFKRVIFDEAHRLEPLAADRISTVFSSVALSRLLLKLHNKIKQYADGGTVLAVIAGHQAIVEGLCAYLASLSVAASGSWGELCAGDPRLAKLWHLWRQSDRKLCAYMQLWSSRDGAIADYSEALRQSSVALIGAQDGAHELWYQFSQRRLVLHRLDRQHAAPISHLPAAALFVASSLSVSDDFSVFADSLAIADYHCHRAKLTSDIDDRALYYLPESLPVPNSPDHIAALMADVLPLLVSNKGRALLLFSSIDNRNKARRWLGRHTDFTLCVAEAGKAAAAIRGFVQSEGRVLLATGLWDGLDISGEALSIVVIDKIPFAAPDDLRVQIRACTLRRTGRDPFKDWLLPQAILRLKQGVGRLIRGKNDGGIVVIGDSRVHYQSYSRQIMQALPHYPSTSDRQSALSFIESRPRSSLRNCG